VNNRIFSNAPDTLGALFKILALMALSCSPARAAPMLTEVIPTQRNAAELVQILRPLIPPPGSINSFRNQLIIKTSEDNLAQIRDVLNKLDKAPENLLIRVRFSDDAEIRRDLAAAHARIRSGNVSLSSGRKQPGRGLNVGVGSGEATAGIRVQRTTTTRSGNDAHTLRVLEGQQAFIRTGQSVPLVNEQVTVTDFGTTVQRTTQFEEFGSGLYVLPRLSGDQVHLEISTRRRRLNSQSNALNSARVQETATYISGHLGRWIEIAGVNSATQSNASGLNSSRVRTTRDHSSIFVKVERLGS